MPGILCAKFGSNGHDSFREDVLNINAILFRVILKFYYFAIMLSLAKGVGLNLKKISFPYQRMAFARFG